MRRRWWVWAALACLAALAPSNLPPLGEAAAPELSAKKASPSGGRLEGARRWEGALTRQNDSAYQLNDWPLPYPVYRFQTGDVDGDGSEDALVGVVKSTRFHPEKGRRLFIFKQVDGHARPMWLGSRLGGVLVDFRFARGRIRALETTPDSSSYAVSEYRWRDFGPYFERFLIKNTDKTTAIKYLNQ